MIAIAWFDFLWIWVASILYPFRSCILSAAQLKVVVQLYVVVVNPSYSKDIVDPGVDPTKNWRDLGLG